MKGKDWQVEVLRGPVGPTLVRVADGVDLLVVGTGAHALTRETGPISSAQRYRRIAADFNRFGESLQRLGLQFGYHNHQFEFLPVS